MSDHLLEVLAAIDTSASPSPVQLKKLLRSIRKGEIPQERLRLEFKQSFTDNTRGWAELVKDVLAMANAGGGLLVLGIDRNGHSIGLSQDLRRLYDPANISNKMRNTRTKPT
jgi:predicted HTH transcriptional regulator